MPLHFDSLAHLLNHGFDDVIDVRSPAEFAEDHVPGAINLPVLDNDERAQVGTIYKQESRFKARKLGAALVIRNIARHLDTELADRPKDWRPLVYCWRGGQRSGTFTWLLREVGWRADSIEGGYRSYRRRVATMLHDQPLPWRFVLLSGMTCTAKTLLLHQLANSGVQVLDLEAAAHHRGSVFGGLERNQPAQKMMETRLAEALSRFDPKHPVVVEAESSKIGALLVPPQIWSAMCAAPRVEITADLTARAAYFMTAYADLVAAPDRFCTTLEALIPLQGRAVVTRWQEQIRDGAFETVAADLMRQHYDPRYKRSLGRHKPPVERLNLVSLSPASLKQAVSRLEEKIARADEKYGGAAGHQARLQSVTSG